jgi:hypothetical protein
MNIVSSTSILAASKKSAATTYNLFYKRKQGCTANAGHRSDSSFIAWSIGCGFSNLTELGYFHVCGGNTFTI